MNETHKNIKNQIKTLPKQPGVYQYYDKDDVIIYVGKAKILKNRVSSYFTSIDKQSGKLKVLVNKIASLQYIVVETELDALLLENNLIKKYRPRYNIMLKDDKTFPWICVKKERFPRVFSTRIVKNDDSDYFGPYASVKMLRTILELIKQLYPIRSCNHNLSKKNIESNKFKLCLDYHIGKCLGPCVGKQLEDDYQNNIIEVKRILKGNISSLIQELKTKMMYFAANMEFEKAQLLKERLEILSNFRSKSLVVNPKMKKLTTRLLASALLILIGFSVNAQDAATILSKMDEVMYSAKDMTGKTTIVLLDKAGKEKTREADIIQKGNDMRIFRFTAPSSQAGIAVLSLPDDVMYIYMPAFGKERRISSSVKKNNFAGTDFSYDDMEAKPYAEKYTPKYIKTEGDAYILELIPKSKKSAYSKLMIKIHKTNYYPLAMDYYDKGNKKVKEGTYKFAKIGNYWNAEEMSITDLKKKHSTKMLMSGVKYDIGLSDDEFTVRKLKQ